MDDSTDRKTDGAKPEQQSVNWGAIGLAFLAIIVGRAILSEPREEVVPDGIVIVPDNLGPTVAVDVFNDGRIVVDGSQVQLDQLESSIRLWKESRSVISWYREPRTDNATPDSERASDAVYDAKLSFSPRREPQRVVGEASGG